MWLFCCVNKLWKLRPKTLLNFMNWSRDLQSPQNNLRTCEDFVPDIVTLWWLKSYNKWQFLNNNFRFLKVLIKFSINSNNLPPQPDKDAKHIHTKTSAQKVWLIVAKLCFSHGFTLSSLYELSINKAERTMLVVQPIIVNDELRRVFMS